MKNNDLELITDFIKGAVSIFKTIFAVFCESFKKKTIPARAEQNPQISDNLRGLIECNYEKCTGCGLCIEVCPSMNTLTIKEDENGVKKLTNIDISKCAFCGSCAYICPNGALNITKQYKLATNNKKDLILDCKEIYKANTQNTDKTLDMPSFVNEEEI